MSHVYNLICIYNGKGGFSGVYCIWVHFPGKSFLFPPFLKLFFSPNSYTWVCILFSNFSLFSSKSSKLIRVCTMYITWMNPVHNLTKSCLWKSSDVIINFEKKSFVGKIFFCWSLLKLNFHDNSFIYLKLDRCEFMTGFYGKGIKRVE